MSLDTLVMETIHALEIQRQEVSPLVVKATIQVARHLVTVHDGLAGDALVESVVLHLRKRHVLLSRPVARAVLATYVRVVSELEVVEICDTLT